MQRARHLQHHLSSWQDPGQEHVTSTLMKRQLSLLQNFRSDPDSLHFTMVVYKLRPYILLLHQAEQLPRLKHHFSPSYFKPQPRACRHQEKFHRPMRGSQTTESNAIGSHLSCYHLIKHQDSSGLSTHSMKSTLLAAAGQLNINIEQRAKQGHHKQSVQFYSRDDVWPSLFLQLDILIDISTGWKPLTSQARGARQPLPEPKFASPPITDSDLRLLQMLARSHHNKQQPTQSDKDGPSPIQAQDDDKESSSSSESDSSSSSDDEVVAPSCAQSLFVMNKKSHIIHAAAQTNPSSTKRACFQSKGSTSKFVVVLLWSEFLLKRYHPFFLVHCASEKHALHLLTTYYLKLSVWEVASLVPEHKRDVFPQMEVFLQFALALSMRCLYTKKMVDHFHLHRMGFPHSIS